MKENKENNSKPNEVPTRAQLKQRLIIGIPLSDIGHINNSRDSVIAAIDQNFDNKCVNVMVDNVIQSTKEISRLDEIAKRVSILEQEVETNKQEKKERETRFLASDYISLMHIKMFRDQWDDLAKNLNFERINAEFKIEEKRKKLSQDQSDVFDFEKNVQNELRNKPAHSRALQRYNTFFGLDENDFYALYKLRKDRNNETHNDLPKFGQALKNQAKQDHSEFDQIPIDSSLNSAKPSILKMINKFEKMDL